MHLEFDIKLSKNAKLASMVGFAVLVMGLVFFSTLYFLNKGEGSIQGLSVGSYSVGRMDEGSVRELLAEKIQEQENTPLTLKTEEGGELEALPSEIGASYNLDQTINAIFSYGKTGSTMNKILLQTKALFIGVHIPASVNIDEKQYTTFVKNNLSSINKPAQNASYEYNEEERTFEFIPASSGIVIDMAHLYSQIEEKLSHLENKDIVVVRRQEDPVVKGEANAIEAKGKAEEILSSLPYTIKSREGEWSIERDDIVSWIEFTPKMDEATGEHKLAADISTSEIENYLTSFAPGLNVSPKNARFSMQNGKVSAFSLAETGYELNVEESAKIISENILNKEQRSELVFDQIEPEITDTSINTLGITALIGRGESDFSGSPRSRRHNIQTGADKFQGLLVAPGEEFSFNKNLGNVTAAEGYLPELVIKQGKTVPEYGGGLCQVSTTLFRAAVYGGLEITQRYNHSYPVSYYGKPGFDATIYPPNPDFRFRNNTEGHLLIQYQINGSELAFEIYGKDDGRKTELDGPHLYDQKASGAVKAWLKQTVYNESGNVMHEKTFYSNYKSPALYPVIRNPLE